MPRTYVAPQVTELPDGKRQIADREETHPAYGQIGASRVSGSTRLYGSDFEHHNYMVIHIRRSKLQRGLANDWPYAGEELIEVALSESQWAAFVSTPNSGMGTQCTLKFYRPDGTIPGIVGQKQRVEHFEVEAQERIDDVVKRLNALEAQIDALSCSKKQRDELKQHVYFARQQIQSNLPYVAKTFGEHMEQTVDKAKTEVHAYVENVIHRAGVAALTNGALPFAFKTAHEVQMQYELEAGERARHAESEATTRDVPDVRDGHTVE